MSGDRTGIYQKILLDHFHHPRNKGGLDGMAIVRRGSNPRCGDELEVGIELSGDRIDAVRFRGRGCSVCIASASMMTEIATGASVDEVDGLARRLQGWFDAPPDTAAPGLPEPLTALSAVQSHPARRRCVLLAWQALVEAVTAAGDPSENGVPPTAEDDGDAR